MIPVEIFDKDEEKRKLKTRLPLHSNGRVDWMKTENMIIETCCEGKLYNIYIKYYNPETYLLTIALLKDTDTYQEWDYYSISTSNFLYNSFYNLIAEKFYNWIELNNSIFEIDYEKSLLRLNRDKTFINKLTCHSNKSIYVKCKKCNVSSAKKPNAITNGSKCGICAGKVVEKGVNDLNTTHFHLSKYLSDIEDGYKFTFGSRKKIKIRCPDCGYEKNIIIGDFSRYGFSCDVCHDHITYPEKFLISVFTQLNVKFKPQASKQILGWCSQFRYDFYIKNKSCIIETHGIQHYEENKIWKATLSDTQDNDKIKETLAKDNGIENYIIIDCRKSNIEWIKNSVINSKLSELFDLSKIDFEECGIYASKNLLLETCKLYNTGATPKEITKILQLGRTTIGRYLNNGDKLGLCKYDGQSNLGIMQRRKVKNLSTGKIFNSISEGGRYYSANVSSIMRVCKGTQNASKGYKWSYVD